MNNILPLAANRAEEKAGDAWKDFIVPPGFGSLDLRNSGQSRVIVGGRGSGKTMLLKYLSYESEFSSDHLSIDNKKIEHVGIYLRADTIFSKALSGNFYDERTWNVIFQHYIACMVLNEIAVSLKYIASSSYSEFNLNDFSSCELTSLILHYDEFIPRNLDQMEEYFYKKNMEFDRWASNLFEDSRRPNFYSLSFLRKFINEVRASHPGLRDLQFFIYVDEYETFLPYQKKILNTFIKHGEKPLVFHFAMKRFVIEEDQSTIGSENIQETHDYRNKPIEDLYKQDYSTFISEIVLYELKKVNNSIDLDQDLLKDESRILERKEEAYRDGIKSKIVKYFPNLTEVQLAEIAFNDQAIARKVFGELAKSLGTMEPSPSDKKLFYDIADKRAAMVAPILLHRETLNYEDVVGEYNAFLGRGSSKVDGWIQNNFIASLLFYYQKFSEKPCPFYAGFDRFLTISDQNLRFMMELCHNSIIENSIKNPDGLECDWISMATAAKVTSEKFFLETRKCGRDGFRLHELVKRLGAIFQVAQTRPTQSENEINHFGFKDGSDSALGESEYSLIVEALKHSILTIRRETKVKKNEFYSQDYILSPIFSPYFKISYRKKRKLEFSLGDFDTIVNGDSKDFSRYIRSLKAKWKIEAESVQRVENEKPNQGSLEL